MPIVFRKIDNLVSNPKNEAAPIGGGSGAQNNQNPYASTFRNPSDVLSANINEKQGDLDTGLNQNIKDAQSNLDKSTQTYTDNLKNIENEQTYAGKDELNKIDDGQFSKLQSLLSPEERQKRMDTTTSSTKFINPDTSAVAAASSVQGLSNQLRNQYNTTAGGSRLDALLYRNSGQAGQALNKNLSDINNFNTTRENYLNNESNALTNSKSNLANTANTVRSDVQGLKQQLGTTAQQQATDAQNTFNTSRQNLLNNEIPELQANTIQNLLKDVALQNNLTQYLPGQNQRSSFQYVPNVDPSLYVSPERTFDQSQFLDSRFNKLAGLLGEEQIAPSASPADTNVAFNRDEYLNNLQESARPDLLRFLQSRVPAPPPSSTTTLGLLPTITNAVSNFPLVRGISNVFG
jgi:phage shock protein A